METDGAVLSTVKVVLLVEAPAELPARSVAVPAAIATPSVPSPVRLVRVMVRVEPLPATETSPVAEPVRFKVMELVASVLELKFVSE